MSSDKIIRAFFEKELILGEDRCPQSKSDYASLSESPLLQKASFIRSSYLKLEIAALKEDDNPYTDWAMLGVGLVDILSLMSAQDTGTQTLAKPDSNIIDNFNQRIKNLEKFKQLFFETYDQLEKLKTDALNSSSPASSPLIETPATTQTNNSYSSLFSGLNDEMRQQSNLTTQLITDTEELNELDSSDNSAAQLQLRTLKSLQDTQSSSNEQLKALEERVELLIQENNTLKEKGSSSKVESTVKQSSNEDAGILDEKQNKIDGLETELNQTTEMVFGFMKNCADLGAILLFITECNKCNTQEEVSNKLFSLTKSMNTDAALLIFNGKNPLFFCSKDELGLNGESSIWSQEADGRLSIHDELYLLHGEKAKLCVSAAAIEDSETLDRLRDNLQTLSLTLDSVIGMIDAKIAQKNESDRFRLLTKTTKSTLDSLNGNYKKHIKEVRQVSEQLISDYKGALAPLTIEGKVKNKLLKLVIDSSNLILTNSSSSLKIDSDFEELIERLNQTK